jgi:hypothetical protein
LLIHTHVPLAKHFYLVNEDENGWPDLKHELYWGTHETLKLETGVVKVKVQWPYRIFFFFFSPFPLC